jgi:hypothetical protein
MADMVAKGRHHGGANWAPKFSDAEVLAIRRRHIAGCPIDGANTLAKDFNATRDDILKVVKGETYRHLPVHPARAYRPPALLLVCWRLLGPELWQDVDGLYWQCPFCADTAMTFRVLHCAPDEQCMWECTSAACYGRGRRSKDIRRGDVIDLLRAMHQIDNPYSPGDMGEWRALVAELRKEHDAQGLCGA